MMLATTTAKFEVEVIVALLFIIGILVVVFVTYGGLQVRDLHQKQQLIIMELWLCYDLTNNANKLSTSLTTFRSTIQGLGSPVLEALNAEYTGSPMDPLPVLLSTAKETLDLRSKMSATSEISPGPQTQ